MIVMDNVFIFNLKFKKNLVKYISIWIYIIKNLFGKLY